MGKRPKSLAAYRDAQVILQGALDKGDLFITFGTSREAGVFVARANTFRSTFRQLEQDQGRKPESPYDSLIIRHVRDENGDRTNKVRIDTRIADLQITTVDGESVSMTELLGPANSVLTPEEKTVSINEDEKFLNDYISSVKPAPIGALGLTTKAKE
jgi:hypothetical protein